VLCSVFLMEGSPCIHWDSSRISHHLVRSSLNLWVCWSPWSINWSLCRRIVWGTCLVFCFLIPQYPELLCYKCCAVRVTPAHTRSLLLPCAQCRPPFLLNQTEVHRRPLSHWRLEPWRRKLDPISLVWATSSACWLSPEVRLLSKEEAWSYPS